MATTRRTAADDPGRHGCTTSVPVVLDLPVSILPRDRHWWGMGKVAIRHSSILPVPALRRWELPPRLLRQAPPFLPLCVPPSADILSFPSSHVPCLTLLRHHIHQCLPPRHALPPPPGGTPLPPWFRLPWQCWRLADYCTDAPQCLTKSHTPPRERAGYRSANVWCLTGVLRPPTLSHPKAPMLYLLLKSLGTPLGSLALTP